MKKQSAAILALGILGLTLLPGIVLARTQPIKKLALQSRFAVTNPQQIAISGDYAYIVKGVAGFSVVNIANPKQPFFVSSDRTITNARRVVIHDSTLYILEYNKLDIFDIVDPAHPRLISTFTPLGLTNDLTISGTIGYLSAGPAGVITIDLSDVTHPVQLGQYDTPGHAQTVVVQGHYAYVADELVVKRANGSLIVLDVTDPAHPDLIERLPAHGISSDVFLVDAYLYLANGGSGLRVYSLASPAAPVLVRRVALPARRASVLFGTSDALFYRSFEYSGAELKNIVTKDAANPMNNGSLPRLHGQGMTVSGKYLYLVNRLQNLLKIYSIE